MSCVSCVEAEITSVPLTQRVVESMIPEPLKLLFELLKDVLEDWWVLFAIIIIGLVMLYAYKKVGA